MKYPANERKTYPTIGRAFRRRSSLLLLPLLWLALLTAPALGLDGSAGSGALQTAINGGGTVSVSGTFLLTSALNVNNPVTIEGPAGGTATIDGKNLYRLLLIRGGGNITLRNLTLQNGKVTDSETPLSLGGGIRWNVNGTTGGVLTLENCTLRNNVTVKGDGGGIAVYDSDGTGSGTLEIKNSTIGGNASSDGNETTDGVGGGIFVAPRIAVTVDSNSIIKNNRAKGTVGEGGGIFIFGPKATAATTVDSSNITLNHADFYGGGIYTTRHIDTLPALTGNTVNATNNPRSLGVQIWDDSGYYDTGATTLDISTSSGSTEFIEQTPVTIDSGLTVTDPDNMLLVSATVTISTIHDSGKETLTLSASDLTGTNITQSGTSPLTLAGVDTIANYQKVLRAVQYKNTSDDPATTSRTITFQVKGALQSDTANRIVTITPVNDAPVVTLESTSASFTEAAGAVGVTATLAISDVDDTHLARATVTIAGGSAPPDGNAESLDATVSGDISKAYDAATGTLTLSGNDTLANYQTALRSVKYTNTRTNPTTSDRTIRFQVEDNSDDSNGKLTSAVQSRTVTVTPMPTVTALSRASEWSNGTTVSWDLTFDTAATGVSAASFTLVPSAGISGAAINSVTGNGKSWVVIATTGTGEGTLGLNLTNTAGVTPKATNTFSGEVYSIDKTVPTIQIGNPSTSITEGGPITYTVTYTDDNFSASTLTAADITLVSNGTATGTVAVDAGTGSTRTVTIGNITGDGALYIIIAAGTAADLAGNAAPATSSTKFKVDNAAPAVTIGAPSASATKGGPVTYTVTYTDTHFDASTLTAADITLNRTGTATGTVAVDAGTGSTRTVTISNITGDGTLGISVAAGTAIDLAEHLAGAAGPSTTFVVDNTAPTVTLGAPSAGITRGGPITYTVTYADDHFNISTLGVAGITLHQTGSADATVSVSPGSGNSRTVTISNITGNGTLGISLAAGTAVDQAGNTAGAAGPSATFVVDNTAPTVQISAPSATLTKGGPVTYTVTYADANFNISTLGVAGVILHQTGSAAGTVSIDPGTDTTRTVTISNITGTGTLGISLAAGTAVDQAGNTAPAAGPGTTFTVDNTAPTVQVSAPSASIARNGPVIYTVTYADANFGASTLTAANITLNPTGTATGTVAVDAGTGSSRTVTISNISGDGTLGISLAAGTAADQAGNSAPAAGPSAAFVVDNTAPTVQISAPSANFTKGGPVTYTVTYADANFNISTLGVAGVNLHQTGSAAGTVSVSPGSGNTRTVTINNITGDGTLAISIAAGTAIDQAGNTAGAAGPSATFVVDNTAPTATLSAPSANFTKGGPITYTVTYADANFNISTLGVAGVTLHQTGSAAGTVSIDPGTGTTRTVTISNITGNGTLGISIASGTAVDQAGNTAGTAGPSATFTVDDTAPTVTIGSPSAGITKGGPVTYTITYADAHFSASTLTAANITLNPTGTATGTVAVDAGSGSTRTVTISNITGNGTLGITIAAGTAADLAGNTAPAAGPSATFVVDNTAPTVTIGDPSATLTKSGPVTYTVTYADANFSASTLTAADVILNPTGTATGTVAVDAGSGNSRTVTVSNITGNGTLAISLAADSAADLAGNTAPAAGPSATLTVDNTTPTLTISEPSASSAHIGPITYTVTYADANFSASTLAATDILLNRTGSADGTVSVDAGTGNTRIVTIDGLSGSGTIGISIQAGTAIDAAGNLAPAAVPSTPFLVCVGGSLTVTTANDSGAGSLRQGMADICPGGTIDFGITGTITLTSGALAADRDLTIVGPGAGSLIVSGNEAIRVFEIADSVQVDLYNITVANGAAETGGGILNQGDLLLGNVTVSGNRASGTDGLGGGIFNAGNLTVTNSTLAENSAPEGDGGAIYNTGSLTVTSSTLSGNSDAGGAGGIYHQAGEVLIANSLLGGNGTNCRIQGTLTDNGNNLEDGDSCEFNAPTSMSDTDPRLDPAGLRDHGGPTRTVALLAGSPAVDAGNEASCPATDQRGTARPQGSRCDIGAYEFVPMTTTAVTSSNGASVYGTLVTFTATVTDSEIASTPSGTVTFRAGTEVIGTGTLDTSAQASLAISSLSAGAHSITAEYAGDGSFTGSTSAALTQKVDKAPQSISFAPLESKIYGDADFNPGATTTSSLPISYTSDNPAVATITADGLIHIVGVGIATITAHQDGNENYLPAATMEQDLSVAKATATVNLGALSQIYDGSAKAASATTIPAELTVEVTYNGSATAPTNAGSYAVVATVVDDNYQGTASGTLTIAKSAATVTLGNLSHPYDGTPKAATASTVPAGLTVTFTYDGSSTPPVAVGSYAVVATVVAANYQGSASGTLEILDTIAPALTLSTLADGATTNEALLNVAGNASDAESGLAGLTVNGAATAVAADGTFSAVVTLTPGANTLTVVATDNAGNQSRETRTIHLDRTTPGVTVTLPDNSATGTDTLELGGTVDDPAAVVTASVNGGAPIPASRSGNAFSLVLTLPPGVNTIEIVVTDAAGNRTVVKRTVTVDLTAPDLAITEPAADTTVRALPLTIRGSVADALSEVTLHLTVNDAAVTPTVAGSTFSYELSATEGGSFRIQATANDLLGNTATAVRNLLYDPYGDADGNGLVEVADALIVLKMAVGQEEPDLHFDVAPLIDGQPHPDGKINVADALVILRRALGLVNW